MRTPRPSRTAALVAIGFAALFVWLRSNQILAVDGAVRCLDVFHDPTDRVHGNNHLLYPFWIWLWTRLAGSLGFAAGDWQSFFHLCQTMNALAAAAAIGILFTILEAVAGTSLALLGAAQFGLTTAVVLHATNAGEPVVGLLFSLAALAALLAALGAGRRLLLLLVGVLLALTLASYQSMMLISPLVAFVCACWPEADRQPGWKTVGSRLALVGAGGLFAIVVVYGLAYAYKSVPPSRMLARFFTLDGAPEVYAGFSVSKVLNLPLGLVRNLYAGLPAEYAGIRSLLYHVHRALWIPLLLAGLLCLSALGWLIAAGVVAAVRRSSIPPFLAWSGILVSACAMAFPLLYWTPVYDKLWMLPLAVLVLASGLALRFGELAGIRRRTLIAGLAVLAVLEGAVNVPRAVGDHLHDTQDLNKASEFAALVGAQDSVVLGFDEISILWLAIWGHDRNWLLLPAANRRQAVAWLANAAHRQSPGDGRLYFVGVLDQDRKAWDSFLGDRAGIPYQDFECYRRNSAIVARYPVVGYQVNVRQLDPATSCQNAGEIR
jgi:hypothetical protein